LARPCCSDSRASTIGTSTTTAASEIAPRKSWEALNFFYDTAFDANMQLVSDEPWSRPGDYVINNEGGIAEYWACREKVVVMDLSPLRKFEVLGPDAETLIQRTITRDARKLSVGQVVYTAICNETGGMIDDATVSRLGDNNFRFVGSDPYDGVWLRDLADRENLKEHPQRRLVGLELEGNKVAGTATTCTWAGSGSAWSRPEPAAQP
jgi:glycine cleavage system aminomethyltransferase T